MLVHPQIDPIAFEIGMVSVRWYGLMYFFGFLGVLSLGRLQVRRHPHEHWEYQDIDDILFYGILGVILGGRLGYVLFYQPEYFIHAPLDIFKVWQGGMSFHGGFIGVAIAMYFYSKKSGKHWLKVTDFVAPLVPFGLALGRLGNFINAELWGRPTDLPWGIVFPNVDNLPRHPSQLYEFGLEGILLFLIMWSASQNIKEKGKISATFLIFYGLFRFSVEFTREPDSFLGLLWFNLSMGQWLSIPMILCGFWLLNWSRNHIRELS